AHGQSLSFHELFCSFPPSGFIRFGVASSDECSSSVVSSLLWLVYIAGTIVLITKCKHSAIRSNNVRPFLLEEKPPKVRTIYGKA
ncbi:hypothetical protein PFISCL1PPCAC_21647, partial [Pristionchus fissidentatus]